MGYLRVLLALCVAVGHIPSGIYGAPSTTMISVGVLVAVKLFFIISGFYMAMIFHTHYSTARMFLVSRAVRLFPAYWLTLVFCVAAALWFKTPYVAPLLNLEFWHVVREPLPLLLVTLSSVSFLGIDVGGFVCTTLGPTVHFAFNWKFPCPDGQTLLLSLAAVPPAWTLSLEWYFYLLVPLCCRLKTKWVALVAGCSFLLTAAITVFAHVHPWHRSLFPAELYLFLLGFLAYRLRHRIPAAAGGTCAALAVVTILAYQHIPLFDWRDPAGANFALYFAFALALPTLFAIGRHLPGERLAGDFSYPLYICHAAIESVILALGLHPRLSLPAWIAVHVLSVLLASALLLVVTGPIERFRLRFKSTDKRAPVTQVT